MEDELHETDKPVRKHTLTAWEAKVGDKFVDLMWEPVLGELAATFVVTRVIECVKPEDTVYDIEFVISYDGTKMPGNKTACTGGVRVRKLM